MVGYPGHVNYLCEELDLHPASQRFKDCLEAMENYSEPWWYTLRQDLGALAAKQFEEPTLLIRGNTFKKGIQKVCKRKISDDELSKKNQSLKDEFFSKYQEVQG